MTDYNILVNAILNSANLQQQINQVQQQVSQAAGGAGGGIPLVNTAGAMMGIREVQSALRTLGLDVQKLNKITLMKDASGNTTGALAQYTNSYKLAESAVLSMDKTTGLFQLSQQRVIQNFAAEQKQIENQAALTKQYTSSLQTLAKENQNAFRTTPVKEAATALQTLIRSQDGSTKSAKDLGTAYGTLRDRVYQANAAATTGIRGWMNEMSIAISRTITWGISMGLIYGTMRKFTEATQYIKDLNKELTNIQIVTGASNEEIARLSRSYNKLASDLGSTTLEVAKGK